MKLTNIYSQFTILNKKRKKMSKTSNNDRWSCKLSTLATIIAPDRNKFWGPRQNTNLLELAQWVLEINYIVRNFETRNPLI